MFFFHLARREEPLFSFFSLFSGRNNDDDNETVTSLVLGTGILFCSQVLPSLLVTPPGWWPASKPYIQGVPNKNHDLFLLAATASLVG